MKRVKTVLTAADVHRVLGLPDTVRIVGMFVRPDPDQLHVLIEGEIVRDWPAGPGPSREELAAAGQVEAPAVPLSGWAIAGVAA